MPGSLIESSETTTAPLAVHHAERAQRALSVAKAMLAATSSTLAYAHAIDASSSVNSARRIVIALL
jgi:hypothetical protein